MFKLSPPPAAGRAWTETVLYSFEGNNDGAYPLTGLIADSTGNLYGIAGGGVGGGGVVFKLSPTAVRGTWTETVLYSFAGGINGLGNQVGLLADQAGNLYGTSINGGVSNQGFVFKLLPSAAAGSAWTEKVLYSFAGGSDGAWPQAGLLADSVGNLYGTTTYGGASNYGTVFKLSPPAVAGGAWTETVLYSFAYDGKDGFYPGAGLIADSAGNLYGTTGNGGASASGTVFKLSPPAAAGGAWTETVLYYFLGSSDGGGSVGFGPKAGLLCRQRRQSLWHYREWRSGG